MAEIACNLAAFTAAERERYALLRARFAGAVREARPIAGGYLLRLDAGGPAAADLPELIALERRCCPFLRLAARAAGDGTTWLEVTGPAAAQELLRDAFAAGVGPAGA